MLWFSFESFAITNAGHGSATIIQQLRNIITQVEENISKFARKGLTPSQIGVILRDSHGIAQVKSMTGSKILRILKAHDYSNI
ncbi:40S ribosomal protein S13-like [Eucalyptus grandis]|uniref:40S ribosomal protein S13-like n=1 Tax=Eucalyptus grandis TaxID=71139 RepID=UPI00192F073B|nr:40S ribosomal protein S13-like [Eucalyptus grandis]